MSLILSSIQQCSWCVFFCQGSVAVSDDVIPSSSSSSSCDEYALIIDDNTDLDLDSSSSNVSVCASRRRHSPVYRSRGRQVRVYVTTQRSFLLVYHGTVPIASPAICIRRNANGAMAKIIV